MAKVNQQNLNVFLRRDWDLARTVKDQRLGRYVQVRGPTAALRLAQLLLDQVWPRARREPARRDLSGLVRLTEIFERARQASR